LIRHNSAAGESSCDADANGQLKDPIVVLVPFTSGSLRNSSKPKLPSGLQKTSTQPSPSGFWSLLGTLQDLSRRDDTLRRYVDPDRTDKCLPGCLSPVADGDYGRSGDLVTVELLGGVTFTG
jgi:hypothetical protein